MLKKLVALTLGVGLFCSGGLCHAAEIRNYIADVEGTVTSVLLHNQKTGAWVIIDSPSNGAVSKANVNQPVKGQVNVNEKIPVGIYDAVAIDHTPFKVKGRIVVSGADKDINGEYVSVTKPNINPDFQSKSQSHGPIFVKVTNGEQPEPFIPIPDEKTEEEAWKNVNDEGVGSYLLDPAKQNQSNVRTIQKLSPSLKIWEEDKVDENGNTSKYKYVNRKQIDFKLRKEYVWAGQGWTAAKHSKKIDGDFKFDDNKTKGELTYSNSDYPYTWTHDANGKIILQAPFTDNPEIEEAEAETIEPKAK